MSKTYSKITTKILIFKSMKIGIFDSNKKLKAGFEPASFSGSVQIKKFCNAMIPLGHSAHEIDLMRNIYL